MDGVVEGFVRLPLLWRNPYRRLVGAHCGALCFGVRHNLRPGVASGLISHLVGRSPLWAYDGSPLVTVRDVVRCCKVPLLLIQAWVGGLNLKEKAEWTVHGFEKLVCHPEVCNTVVDARQWY